MRRSDSTGPLLVLPPIAFAFATGALLTVLGGLSAFAHRPGPDSEVYLIFAQTATVLLVVPVITLGGAAARLSVSRRNRTAGRAAPGTRCSPVRRPCCCWPSGPR